MRCSSLSVVSTAFTGFVPVSPYLSSAGSPELGSVFQTWPQQYGVERKGNTLQSASNALPDAAQNGSLLSLWCIAGWRSTCCPPGSQTLSQWSCSSETQHVLVLGVIALHWQNFAFPFSYSSLPSSTPCWCLLPPIFFYLWTWWGFAPLSKFLMKRLNNIGFPMDPWGTPPVRCLQLHFVLLITTPWAWLFSHIQSTSLSIYQTHGMSPCLQDCYRSLCQRP